MKRIVYLLAALIPALAFTSCDDHDDLPDVNFNVSITGGEFSSTSDIYIVQGDTLDIEGVEVFNNEHGKGVTIPYVNYYFDRMFIGQNPIAPYGYSIVTENIPIGVHYLELSAPVFAVDKAPGYAVITYKVNVVESVDDMPGDGVQAVISSAHMTDNNSNS